jgi:flavorubredoxin
MTTRIDEIADSIYRISTPVPPNPGLPTGFSFNQFLVVDDEPLLFHTGLVRIFPDVVAAARRVLAPERLRWIAFSHVEADECGALNRWLAAAPHASPVCSHIAAMTSIADIADRPPRPLADGEVLAIGKKRLTWIDAPHVPHGWECGFLHENTTATLLCGDLFTQAGAEHPPITEADILEPSEAMRSAMEYYARGPNTRSTLERLADLSPRTLACMHGAAFAGDGAALLRALADRLA